MSAYALTTPREADSLIAKMFNYSPTCEVLVREEKAFKGEGTLSLGSISVDSNATTNEQLLRAVRRGAFGWKLPTLDAARAQLRELLGINTNPKWEPKLSRALNIMAAISVRSGLQHPNFDPFALEAMPFRRSTTVVADTSGALQGGLDFVARYLHPAARVKVPAIVQMEVVNHADRFLSGRRAAKTKSPDLLIDHLVSQGGQRVLLRLELQADIEIERNFLLSDPLRSAFQVDKDPDLAELNLSVSIRAYVDRLVLEAARQHQAQANFGHKVQLLTSDQGLARMALAEGVAPLFFTSVTAEQFFDHRFTGITFDPFSGQLRETAIASLLWELATAFGSARLDSSDKAHSLTISAIGDDLSWMPYQSHADLLWCDRRTLPPDKGPSPPTSPNPSAGSGSDSPKSQTKKKTFRSKKASAATESSEGEISPLRFNVEKLLSLVDAIDNHQSISDDQIVALLDAKNRHGIEEYRRFLCSAHLIEVVDHSWKAVENSKQLAIALRSEDPISVRNILLGAPSFKLFAEQISALRIGEVWKPDRFARAATTYRTLGEITYLCAPIEGEGIYATPNKPDAIGFAKIAIQRFDELDRGDALVATGAWLEKLIRKDGIHPEIARSRLNDASEKHLLLRSTEGSTTDVRFDNHTIQVLQSRSGKPVIVTIHLYRGDYLIPGKSSTSLRIEEPQG